MTTTTQKSTSETNSQSQESILKELTQQSALIENAIEKVFDESATTAFIKAIDATLNKIKKEVAYLREIKELGKNRVQELLVINTERLANFQNESAIPSQYDSYVQNKITSTAILIASRRSELEKLTAQLSKLKPEIKDSDGTNAYNKNDLDTKLFKAKVRLDQQLDLLYTRQHACCDMGLFGIQKLENKSSNRIYNFLTAETPQEQKLPLEQLLPPISVSREVKKHMLIALEAHLNNKDNLALVKELHSLRSEEAGLWNDLHHINEGIRQSISGKGDKLSSKQSELERDLSVLESQIAKAKREIATLSALDSSSSSNPSIKSTLCP